MAVADDSLPVVSALIIVLMVPSLDRVVRFSRRSLVGRRCMPGSWYFSWSTWPLWWELRYWYDEAIVSGFARGGPESLRTREKNISYLVG